MDYNHIANELAGLGFKKYSDDGTKSEFMLEYNGKPDKGIYVIDILHSGNRVFYKSTYNGLPIKYYLDQSGDECIKLGYYKYNKHNYEGPTRNSLQKDIVNIINGCEDME